MGSLQQSLCASSARGGLAASPPAAAALGKDVLSEWSVTEKSGVGLYFQTVNKISPGIKVEELAPLHVIQNHKFPLLHNLPELETLLQLLKNSRCFPKVSILLLRNTPREN